MKRRGDSDTESIATQPSTPSEEQEYVQEKYRRTYDGEDVGVPRHRFRQELFGGEGEKILPPLPSEPIQPPQNVQQQSPVQRPSYPERDRRPLPSRPEYQRRAPGYVHQPGPSRGHAPQFAQQGHGRAFEQESTQSPQPSQFAGQVPSQNPAPSQQPAQPQPAQSYAPAHGQPHPLPQQHQPQHIRHQQPAPSQEYAQTPQPTHYQASVPPEERAQYPQQPAPPQDRAQTPRPQAPPPQESAHYPQHTQPEHYSSSQHQQSAPPLERTQTPRPTQHHAPPPQGYPQYSQRTQPEQYPPSQPQQPAPPPEQVQIPQPAPYQAAPPQGYTQYPQSAEPQKYPDSQYPQQAPPPNHLQTPQPQFAPTQQHQQFPPTYDLPQGPAQFGHVPQQNTQRPQPTQHQQTQPNPWQHFSPADSTAGAGSATNRGPPNPPLSRQYSHYREKTFHYPPHHPPRRSSGNPQQSSHRRPPTGPPNASHQPSGTFAPEFNPPEPGTSGEDIDMQDQSNVPSHDQPATQPTFGAGENQPFSHSFNMNQTPSSSFYNPFTPFTPSQSHHDQQQHARPAENPRANAHQRHQQPPPRSGFRGMNSHQTPPPQPQPTANPSPFSMDMGDFMGHWTSMFNTIHASMQEGLKAQTEASRMQTAALEALATRFDHLSASFAKRRPRSAKRSKTPGNEDNGEEADDESDHADVPTERDIHIVHLQEYIRSHLKGLLNIKAFTQGELEEMTPLTEEEIRLFDEGDNAPGAPPPPSISNKDFRIDFTRGMKECAFNRAASHEFIEHFLRCLKDGHYTEKGVIPEEYRTDLYVLKCLDMTCKYIREIYRGKKHDKKLRAQGQRRDTLRESRRRACADRRRESLQRHILPGGILKRAKRSMMSGDETDTPGPPKTYRILRPAWQSDELAEFFWRLDEIDREHWRSPVEQASTAGNPLRIRLSPTPGKRTTNRAPSGLWRNCYHPAFLKTLRDWDLRALDMIDEDYDFLIPPEELARP